MGGLAGSFGGCVYFSRGTINGELEMRITETPTNGFFSWYQKRTYPGNKRALDWAGSRK